MADYRTYRKEKWICLALSILAYFLPSIVVSSVFLPMIKAASGFKVALGLGIVLINTVPFLMGVFRAFFAHFPMFNLLAAVFLLLAAFFTFDIFQRYVDIFLWIELAAALGSIASCIFWVKYRRYKEASRTVKDAVRSGAFVMKEAKNDQGK